MTNTTTINAAIEIKEGLARIEDLKQELARANEDLWHDHVRHLEDDLKYGGTVSWPCSDCGEPITIKKVETLLFIIRSGGHYCHGDC